MDLHTLRYSPDHLWVRLDDDSHVTVGLTEEALKGFGYLTKIRLPSEGDEFSKDESLGRLSDGQGSGFKLIAPLSGEILAVNEDIVDTPEAILEDPYEEGWLVRLEIHSMHEYDDLMSRDEYDEFIDGGDFADDDLDDDDDDEYDGDDDDDDLDDDDDYFDDDDDDDDDDY